MAIPYNNNIPQATDQPRNSQPLILQNFANLETFLAVNHEDFPSANAGKHKFVSLPEQAATPATAIDEVAVFCKLGVRSAQSELCFRRENNFATYVPFTEQVSAMPGWFVTPGGILIKWVQAVVPLAGVGTFAFENTFNWNVAANIPVFGTAPFMVLVTSQVANAASYGHIDIFKTASATTTQFTLVTESTLSLGGWNQHNAFVVGFGT